MPAAWFFVLRPARFLDEEGQGGLLAPQASSAWRTEQVRGTKGY